MSNILKSVVVVLIAVFFLSGNAWAVFGYITEKSTEHVISYFDLNEKPANTDEYTFTVCVENDKPELWEDPSPVYSSTDLLIWAYGNMLNSEPVSLLDPAIQAKVESYTIRFSEHADNAGASLFVGVATSLGDALGVDLKTPAETVVAKAVELGADITGE